MWTCPLCGLPGRKTKEHVNPEWMIRSWPADVRTTIRGEDRGRYHIKVHVCEDCNAWMNTTFEIPARPLLDRLRAGRRTELSPADQTLIAGWLTKTVLMLSLWSTADRDRYLRPEDYQRFRRRVQHPVGTRIWLSSVEDADPGLEAAVGHAVPRSWIFPFGSSVNVQSYDHLVVLWIRDNRPDDAIRASRDPRKLIRRCVRAGLFVPVWPAAGEPIRWPPAVPFDVTTYERWSNLFGWR